jgi:hypothetical protein
VDSLWKALHISTTKWADVGYRLFAGGYPLVSPHQAGTSKQR